MGLEARFKRGSGFLILAPIKSFFTNPTLQNLAAVDAAARFVNLKLSNDGIDCVFGIAENHACVVFKEQWIINARKTRCHAAL